MLITAKGRQTPLAAHTLLSSGWAALQSHSFSREGHDLRGLSTVQQVAGQSWDRLLSSGFAGVRDGTAPASSSSLAALSLALYAHHQSHLSESVELSLLFCLMDG